MKLTIDTEAKTIKLEEEITLDQLTKELKKMFLDYKDYKIIPFEVKFHYYPTYVKPYIQTLDTIPRWDNTPDTLPSFPTVICRDVTNNATN